MTRINLQMQCRFCPAFVVMFLSKSQCGGSAG